jgi:hypothetical protein
MRSPGSRHGIAPSSACWSGRAACPLHKAVRVSHAAWIFDGWLARRRLLDGRRPLPRRWLHRWHAGIARRLHGRVGRARIPNGRLARPWILNRSTAGRCGTRAHLRRARECI